MHDYITLDASLIYIYYVSLDKNMFTLALDSFVSLAIASIYPNMFDNMSLHFT